MYNFSLNVAKPPLSAIPPFYPRLRCRAPSPHAPIVLRRIRWKRKNGECGRHLPHQEEGQVGISNWTIQLHIFRIKCSTHRYLNQQVRSPLLSLHGAYVFLAVDFEFLGLSQNYLWANDLFLIRHSRVFWCDFPFWKFLKYEE